MIKASVLRVSALLLTFLVVGTPQAQIRFEIAYPEAAFGGPYTGRIFLAVAQDDAREPRLQVGRYGVPFFGEDVDSMQPARSVVIDGSTLGYPVDSLDDLPDGEYIVQAVLDKYTEFVRADGHTVWMPMDQWEGQNWRRRPGNLVSAPQHLTLERGEAQTVRLTLDRELPPVDVPADTEWVQRIRIRSGILSDWWGHDIYLGATVLLPRNYDQHPDASYPTVYQQGHFSLRAPFRFEEGSDFGEAWAADDFPRFLAVTIQHPTPYFDDSYAVNSENNGPYGDAIHQELIPEIERRYRAIRESYARVLTGGSTGGWESFALQVFYPDFYGGTWSYAPDPLDFRNVEGINIYDDVNAFYKQYEWHRAPTINTRVASDGAPHLTSAQRNRMELVNGTRGRSGQQLDIWSATFGPVGDDGYFKPLFDKATGVMDPSVAEYWREHYDMRHILERDWDTLGPKLVGKLHIIVGHIDQFFLNWGVYYLEEFLSQTTDPYYDGSITYGHRGSHGYRNYTSEQLLRVMAEHIRANAPAGVDPRVWNY